MCCDTFKQQCLNASSCCTICGYQITAANLRTRLHTLKPFLDIGRIKTPEKAVEALYGLRGRSQANRGFWDRSGWGGVQPAQRAGCTQKKRALSCPLWPGIYPSLSTTKTSGGRFFSCSSTPHSKRIMGDSAQRTIRQIARLCRGRDTNGLDLGRNILVRATLPSPTDLFRPTTTFLFHHKSPINQPLVQKDFPPLPYWDPRSGKRTQRSGIE